MEYATEVSKFVAQGACRDLRRAYENWRNPELRAARPSFKRKNRTGTGFFLATSGVTRIKYDGHRHIKLPDLGSVKLKRALPEGIPYEVRISRQNGRWYASVNYWKPPVGAEEKTHLCGAVDVGIAPPAHGYAGLGRRPGQHGRCHQASAGTLGSNSHQRRVPEQPDQRRLVVHQFWIDGYKDFNFMRASAVVKRQSTFMAS